MLQEFFDKILEKLPYAFLGRFKFIHFFMAGVGLGVLIFVGHFFSVYSGQKSEYDELAQKKGQQEELLKKNQMLAASKNRVAQEYSVVQANFEDVRRQMPVDREIPDLLKSLNHVTDDLDLGFVQFQVMEGKITDYYKEIPIHLIVVGNSWNTVGFFDAIQDMARVVNFSDLKMEMVPEKGAKPQKAGAVEEPKKPVTEINARIYAYIEGKDDPVKAAAALAAAAAAKEEKKPAKPGDKDAKKAGHK
jgi:Tfp pilus assembly protein PilO